jgi:cell division protein FtsB
MYATEKYLKMEVKELLNQIKTVAGDLGSDIAYLHAELTALQDTVMMLQREIEELKYKNV